MNQSFVRYAIVFLGLFLVFYWGTYAFIGITSEGGKFYVCWLDKYFNYVNWLRAIILNGAALIAKICGFETTIPNIYTVTIPKLASVRLVYTCLGYGILSFWFAFIIANRIKFMAKVSWALIGVLLILFSNMLRIAIILIATAKKWPTLFKVDHHTIYNICNYILLILLIFLFNRKLRSQLEHD